MVLSQNISVALGVLTLCALVGAGVGVGSGALMVAQPCFCLPQHPAVAHADALYHFTMAQAWP